MNTKKIMSMLLAFVVLISLAACTGANSTQTATPTPAAKVELTISAAASLTDALTEIADLYKKVSPEVTLTFNFAASGNLQTQIEEGAPCDIFISAAQKQMTALTEKTLVDTQTKIDLLENSVVLITPADNAAGISSFEDCIEKSDVIAIGDPASVPAGQYAKEVFTNLKLWDAVSAKAALATNVREVLSWVETGNAQCGIVYATDAASSSKIKIVSEAPAGTHQPVIYPAAVIAGSANKDASKLFLAYLTKDDAKKVFEKAGFKTIA